MNEYAKQLYTAGALEGHGKEYTANLMVYAWWLRERVEERQQCCWVSDG